MSVSPLELITKNFHAATAAAAAAAASAGTVSFSQANSIFLHQSDFLDNSAALAATKKTSSFGAATTTNATWGGASVRHIDSHSSQANLEPLHIHIKREPCQVSEITTSHQNLAAAIAASAGSSATSSQATAVTARTANVSQACVVKLEPPSPKERNPIMQQSPQLHQQHQNLLASVSMGNGTGMDTLHSLHSIAGLTAASNNTSSSGANNVIPVGIAVARQRPQDLQQQQQSLHTPVKDATLQGRFGLQPDLGT